jgi:beta-lactamase regulating signal transducer with metallopeptidase domain
VVDAWLHGLLSQTLALSIAAIVVRTLQAVVTRHLGAASGYLAWLLVPVAMLAVALPHAATRALVIHVDVAAVAPAWLAARPAASASRLGAASALAMAAWVAGALLLAALLLQRQRRFEALVDVSSQDAKPTLPAGAGPAVLGVWRRRVVLPRDFDSAFDAEERRLMLLHEGVHLRRGDNLWNLLAATLLVAHWFNPIAWWAWRRLRADQELACDAAVLRHESPATLATYAGALLKAQGVALTPPLATAWQSTHPLVERVRMLQVHRISSARHRAGLRVAALSIVLAGIGGYTLQAGAGALPAAVSNDDASVMTTLDITHTTKHATAPDVSTKRVVTSQIRILVRTGREAVVRFGSKNVEPYEIGLTVSRLDGDRLQIDTRVSAGNPLALVGTPRLVVHDGEKGSVAIDTGETNGAFAISLTPKVVAGPAADAIDTRKPPALPPPPVQPRPAVPALPLANTLPPLPPAPTPQSLPALPPLPADPPPPQRAL